MRDNAMMRFNLDRCLTPKHWSKLDRCKPFNIGAF